METNKIICGDCIEEIKKFPDNSVDSIVTDPPYDLISIVKRFGNKGSAEAKYGKDGSFQRLSGGFMGKKWDGTGIAFKVEIWKEALRVLKPGGHLLSFGGTRTYHRMACAIEDAGFEIRDMVEWLYASGFPKSLNIGKAVDKMQGNERDETEYVAPDGKGRWGGNSFSVGKPPDGRGVNKATKGNSEWEGWGTALKPAHEPICLARKPLSEKTIALNVLKWGTGGLNIDGGRIGTDKPIASHKGKSGFATNYKSGDSGNYLQSKGRFPANLILSEQGAKELDRQSGVSKSQRRRPEIRNYKPTGNQIVNFGGGNKDSEYQDIGGASRFFYVAKASKRERNMGCEGLKPNPNNVKYGIERLNTPNKQNNSHPTVKPLKLMEYLVNLITPPGGIVLDPFAGSGTTCMACKKLGFRYIGIDQSKEYCEIARSRIKAVKEDMRLF